MKPLKQKWLYQTIAIDSMNIDNYIAFIKQGYCVFDVNKEVVTYLCSQFEYSYSQNKDNDLLYEYAKLLRLRDFHEKDDDEKSFQIMSQLAELHYVKAYHTLGMYYYDGVGTEEDLEKSFHYFTLAAQEGYIPSINSLSVFYYYGYVVEEDRVKSFQMVLECAEQGLAVGQTNVAIAYLNGEGVKQDYQKALHYILLAVKQNHTRAYFVLGKMYFEGIGVEKDYDNGFYYTYKAAEGGNKTAKKIIKELGDKSQLLYQNKLWYKIDEEDI